MTDGSLVLLTPQHAGRVMRTRDGQRVGPIEFDSESFGYENDKHWRGSLGTVRGYYFESGRVREDEESPVDIVGE